MIIMPGLEMIKPLLTYPRVSTRFRQLFRNDHLVLSVLAIVGGAVVGISVVGFREAIGFFQGVFYGLDGFLVMKMNIWRRLQQSYLVGALFWQPR